jgi:hypothetical protein
MQYQIGIARYCWHIFHYQCPYMTLMQDFCYGEIVKIFNDATVK